MHDTLHGCIRKIAHLEKLILVRRNSLGEILYSLNSLAKFYFKEKSEMQKRFRYSI